MNWQRPTRAMRDDVFVRGVVVGHPDVIDDSPSADVLPATASSLSQSVRRTSSGGMSSTQIVPED
jgi:hypothetical protein